MVHGSSGHDRSEAWSWTQDLHDVDSISLEEREVLLVVVLRDRGDDLWNGCLHQSGGTQYLGGQSKQSWNYLK